MSDLDLRDSVTGKMTVAKGTNDALHVYGLASNIARVSATSSTTDFYGFLVEAQPTADDTSITPINGTEITGIAKETFTEGQVYPIHGTAITVGTGGKFLMFIG